MAVGVQSEVGRLRRVVAHRPGPERSRLAPTTGGGRNVATGGTLRRHGIEVVSVAGSEHGQCRGGPRHMTRPIEREPAEAGAAPAGRAGRDREDTA
jgi:arginine deiminase